jgi:8-oxo-dGTP pyrophosphatase MutT (NUDIX family)
MLPNDAFYASLHRRRVGAGVLFVNEQGWPLVVEPTYKPTWEIPGGAVEAGEDPRTCALREVREELGIEIGLGRMLVIDHKSELMPRGDSTMIIYDGGVLTNPSSIRLNEEELRSFRFMPEEELDEYLTAGLAFRVRSAIRAVEAGTMVEIVDGQRV